LKTFPFIEAVPVHQGLAGFGFRRRHDKDLCPVQSTKELLPISIEQFCPRTSQLLGQKKTLGHKKVTPTAKEAIRRL
jgi:hypothetical protein